MATTKSQRIGIWIITGALVIGTLGGFLALVLAPKNQSADQARFEELQKAFSDENTAYQAKLEEHSKQYFDEFTQYESRIAEFNADEVKELGVEDLREGEGEALTAESRYAVFYMGWNPKGVMFDSSFNADKTALSPPLIHDTDGMWEFPGGNRGSVIEGWTKGLEGIKMNGVRELTLPADLAYGEQGSGENIPANTPLKFVMMVVPTPDITKPTMSQELKDLYVRLQGIDPRLFEGL